MGGHRGLLVASVGIVGLVVGLATGCSGAQGASGPDDGRPTASTSSPHSASASPTASATLDGAARARIPKAARAHTAQGAEAFARFYLEQVNQAWMVPDPELIRPYALQACKTCANYVATAEWLRRQDLRFGGPPSSLGASGVLPESKSDDVIVQIVQVQQSAKLLHSDGSVEREVPRAASLLDVAVTWRADTWHAVSIKGEPS